VISGRQRVRTPDQNRSIMISRPACGTKEATVAGRRRKLHATKWFVPGAVAILTKNDPGRGRVTILVYVTELTSVRGGRANTSVAQHIGRTNSRISGNPQGRARMNPAGQRARRQSISESTRTTGGTTPRSNSRREQATDTRVVYQIVEGRW